VDLTWESVEDRRGMFKEEAQSQFGTVAPLERVVLGRWESGR
jgi:hypothetical protein